MLKTNFRVFYPPREFCNTLQFSLLHPNTSTDKICQKENTPNEREFFFILPQITQIFQIFYNRIFLFLTERTKYTEFFLFFFFQIRSFYAYIKLALRMTRIFILPQIAQIFIAARCFSPTDYTDFSDFLPSGYNDSLFDFVKLLPLVVIIASFGIV